MARVLIIAYRVFTHDPHLRRNAEALAARGDKVDVICLAVDGHAYQGPINVVAFPAPRYRGKSRMHYVMHYLRFFSRATFAAMSRMVVQPYDLAMAISMPDAAVFGCLGTKLRGAKIVLDITDMMPELYRDRFGEHRWNIGAKLLLWQERLSAFAADRVLAVHELHRRRLEDAGINPGKIRVVMNSPDPHVFGVQKCSYTPRDEFVTIYHGSLIRRLGVGVAIEAISYARHSIPNLRLWILGSGDYSAEAQKLIARFKLKDQVILYGSVPVEKVATYVSRADIGLVPNYVNDATHFMLPMKLLEYAHLGIPIISARLKAVEYYFGDEAVNYFAAGDAHDLARAIEELYRNPHRREQLAHRGRKAMETIDWSTQRENYYEALDSLLPSKEL